MNNWYNIQAKADSTVDLFLNDEIGFFGILAEDLIQEFDNISPKVVNMEIDSPGGDVFEAVKIFHFLKKKQSEGVTVNVIVKGLAASSASFLALVAPRENRTIVRPSSGMIHNASVGAKGDHKTLRARANAVESISKEMAAIYVENNVVGASMEDILNMMSEETWFTAEEFAAFFGFKV